MYTFLVSNPGSRSRSSSRPCTDSRHRPCDRSLLSVGVKVEQEFCDSWSTVHLSVGDGAPNSESSFESLTDLQGLLSIAEDSSSSASTLFLFVFVLSYVYALLFELLVRTFLITLGI